MKLETLSSILDAEAKIRNNRSEWIKNRIGELCDIHGSLRAVSRYLGLDVGYLHRLKNGKMRNPSENVLRKLADKM